MNPYLPPASVVVPDDGTVDLVRLGRGTGALIAAAIVLVASGWVMVELKVFGPFLWVHGSVAMLMLVLSAAWGGGFIARRSGGGWLPWFGAILRVAVVCLLSGDAGLILSSAALSLLRSQGLFENLVALADPREQLLLLGNGFLLAVAFAAAGGLFLRHCAQKQGPENAH